MKKVNASYQLSCNRCTERFQNRSDQRLHQSFCVPINQEKQEKCTCFTGQNVIGSDGTVIYGYGLCNQHERNAR